MRGVIATRETRQPGPGGRCAVRALLAVHLGTTALVSPAQVLDQIVVSGTRTERTVSDSPVRVEVVDQQAIERQGAATLTDALRDVPGLSLSRIHGKSGFAVSLQGFDSDRVLILVDGLPLSASTGSTVDLSQYLTSTIERIEVIKGAASAQYGSAAMGGVINVITRPLATGFGYNARLDARTRFGQNLSGDSADVGWKRLDAGVFGGSDALRWRVGVQALADQGFTTETGSWDLDGDRVDRRQLTGRVGWYASKVHYGFVDVDLYEEQDLQRYSTFRPPSIVQLSKTEDISRRRLSGRYANADLEAFGLDLRGVWETYRSNSLARSNGVAQTDRRARFGTGRLSAQFDLPESESLALQLGGEVFRETLKQTVNGAPEVVGGDQQRQNLELFAQADWFVSERTEAVFGLRVQDDSGFGFHASPKVSLRRVLGRENGNETVARISLGSGYRVPNLKERYYVFDHSALGYTVNGNPSLVPERSVSLQAGLDIARRNSLVWSVNLFYNDIDDLIQTDGGSVAQSGIENFRYVNVARARTAGAETSVRWWPHKRVGLSAAYTYTHTRDLDTGSELTRKPRIQVRAGMDWSASSRWSVGLRTRLQSDELVNTDTQIRSPRWAAVDIFANYRLARGWTLFAALNNLTNTQQIFSDPFDFRPEEGRNATIGVKFNSQD